MNGGDSSSRPHHSGEGGLGGPWPPSIKSTPRRSVGYGSCAVGGALASTPLLTPQNFPHGPRPLHHASHGPPHPLSWGRMQNILVPAMRFASESSFKPRSFASNGREAFHLPPLKNKGGGERNGAPPVPASQRDAGAVICDRSPFGAPPRLCAGIIHPNSAWAALPGIAGCKRGSPLRRQCSRHPAVRSRPGRVDAQTACKLRATNSAYRNRSRSVSRVTG